MAAITSANVTLITRVEMKGKGILTEVMREVAIVLSSQGGTSGDIPASALSMVYVDKVEQIGFIDGSSALRYVPGVVEYTTTGHGTGILPIDLTNATDANRNLPANVTGTWRVRVYGREVNNY